MSAILITENLPRTNIPSLSGRYWSNLPTTYFNHFTQIQGVVDLANMNEYFNTIRRRLDGIPSNSESESESMIFDSISVEENFSDSLLLQTSKKTVHLIDPGLFSSTDDKSMHVLAVYIPSFQILPGNFSRLSLLNFIPEFSLCIIGNQFGSEIFF